MGLIDDLKNKVASFRLKGQQLQQDVAAVQVEYATASSVGDDARAALLYETLQQGRGLEGDWLQAWNDIEAFLVTAPTANPFTLLIDGGPLLARVVVIEQKISLYQRARSQMAPPTAPDGLPLAAAGAGTAVALGLGALLLFTRKKQRRR